MGKLSNRTVWGLVLGAGVVLTVGSVTGLHSLPDPPDPSQGMKAFEEYQRWTGEWFIIAIPGLVGLWITAGALLVGLFGGLEWLWSQLAKQCRQGTPDRQ